MKMTKITVLTLLLFSSLVSCIKQLEEEESIPATQEEIVTSLSEAWGNADPLTMKTNDFINMVTEQTVDTNPNPFYELEEGVTVSGKVEDAEKYKYTYLYQHRITKNGVVGAESSREQTRNVYKSDPNIAAVKTLLYAVKPFADDQTMVLGFERLYSLAYTCEKTEALQQYCVKEMGLDSCDIECSNLKVSELLVPVPAAIMAQPNCGGFANCKIKTKTVKFDWTVLLKKDKTVEKQKVNYSITFSPDLPFFARMTEYCFRQLFTIPSGNKVLVNSCTSLKNYRPGPPVP